MNGVGGKILGKLVAPSVKDNNYEPMKLGNNAKEREKMLANMGRFTQSKVDCGNTTTNLKKPPNPRSGNSKSPMPSAKRDLKVDSVKKTDLKSNGGSNQKNFLQPGKNMGTKSVKSNDLNIIEDVNKNPIKNYKNSKTSFAEMEHSLNNSRNNSHIFDIPELDEEPVIKSRTKIMPMKLSNTSHNSDYSSNGNQSNNRNGIKSNNSINTSDIESEASNNQNYKKSKINNPDLFVNRENLKTLQTEEDTDELEILS